MKKLALLAILICASIIPSATQAASGFMDEFSGTKVKCQIGNISEELFKNFPFKVDFKLVKINLKFDDSQARDFYRNTMSIDPDNLFIITYEVKSNQGTFTSNFIMDKRSTVQTIDEKGNEVLSFNSPNKSIQLTAHDGILVDKYVFVKNGIKLFTCSRLDLF